MMMASIVSSARLLSRVPTLSEVLILGRLILEVTELRGAGERMTGSDEGKGVAGMSMTATSCFIGTASCSTIGARNSLSRIAGASLTTTFAISKVVLSLGVGTESELAVVSPKTEALSVSMFNSSVD